MKIYLNILGVKIKITSTEEVSVWIKHDYSQYLVESLDSFDLEFNLISEKYNREKLPELSASLYHDDYIVYDSDNIRIIDFFSGGLSIFKTKEKVINIYCENVDILYEIFYLSFESLLGEELDHHGFHRIHCLALEKNGEATLLLLPPGAGKTTLALKFLKDESIKVLAEDMIVYKKGVAYGLHFRWGTRDMSFKENGRLMRREKHEDKVLLNVNNFSLTGKAKIKNIILGQRFLSDVSKIEKIGKLKIFFPMFKSMVLGLELQQSMAYFLLRNVKDIFLKSRLTIGRLTALVKILVGSKSYEFTMGQDIEKNYNTLKFFFR